ncbi:MAG: ComF family protein [Alphaproteobacteria bacterium]|jgi:ComF family protein|nr:ComF family protein [Alphaproteobacteria bacterium]
MTWTGAFSDAARSAGSRLLDSLLPPQCISCEAPVDTQGSLCPVCWSKVRFIERPLCAACGIPFEFDQGDDALCGACVAEPPAYNRARSVMVYDARSRDLILRFKHADRTDAAPTFAKWMTRAGQDLVRGADLVVPVPLHRARLLKRRYNQAALLSNGIADLLAVERQPALLARVRNTPSQGGRSRTARISNVTGAFQVREKFRGMVEGRSILLVDDVMTTGATVEACAKSLTKSGAHQIDVLTLARVVRASAGAI